MVHATFYMHQTSGACAGMCACNHSHQMGKTDQEVFCTWPKSQDRDLNILRTKGAVKIK